MPKRRAVLRGTFIGIAAFLLTFPIVFIFAGAGHGSYLPAKLIFPFAVLIASYISSADFPLLAAAALQFPLYGVAGAISRKYLTLAICVHIVAATTVIALRPQSFTP